MWMPKGIYLQMAYCHFILVNAISESMVFNENIHILQEGAANCVLEIATRFFYPSSTLALVKSNRYKTNLTLALSTEDIISKKLLKKGMWSNVMKFVSRDDAKDADRQWLRPKLDYGFEKIHNYVIVIQTIEDLDNLMFDLSSSNSWNPFAKFLLFPVGFKSNFSGFMTALVRVMWKYFAINLMVVAPRSGLDYHLLITYFPFHGGHCGRQLANYTLIGTCYNSSIQPAELNCYPNKVPQDMNHCLVRVGTVHSPPFVIQREVDDRLFVDLDSGIEMKILKTLAATINIDVELGISFLTEDHLWTGKNISGGVLKELADKKFDIAIGTLFPTIASHRQFDFSVQYTDDMAAWVVPSDEMFPKWLSLLWVFQPAAYAATFLLLAFFWFISTSIVKTFQFNFRNEHFCYKNRLSFFLIIVGILFANIPHKFPQTTFLKYLMFVWLVFCLHWSTAYNATLMSVLTNNVFTDDGVETEVEIIEGDFRMMATNRTARYFQQFTSRKNVMKLCLDSSKCIKDIGIGRHAALAMSRKNFDYIKHGQRDEYGNMKVKMLKSNIVTSPVEMLLAKGHPLLSRINQILLEIIESGLIDYWTRNISESLPNENTYTNEDSLNLHHLAGVFIILSVGLLVSSFVYFGEWIYFHVLEKGRLNAFLAKVNKEKRKLNKERNV